MRKSTKTLKRITLSVMTVLLAAAFMLKPAGSVSVVFAEGEDGTVQTGDGVLPEENTEEATEVEERYDTEETTEDLNDMLNSEQYNGVLDDADEGIIDSNSTGTVDIFSGNRTEGGEVTASTSVITLSDDVLYDSDRNMFVYPVQDGYLYISVIDGMVVTDAVSLTVDGDFNMTVYKDGEEMTEITDTISNPGSYTIIVWDNNSENRLLAFDIVGNVTGALDKYTLPSGFYVKSVYINGSEIRPSQGEVDMTKEGFYEISYTNYTIGRDFALSLTVDHTPPELKLEGVGSDNKARGPVTVSGLGEGDFLYITLDGDEKKLNYQHQLTQSGTYRVIAMDEAGNVIQKDFEILLYLNVKSVVLIGAFILIVAGVIVALYIERKRLRVR